MGYFKAYEDTDMLGSQSMSSSGFIFKRIVCVCLRASLACHLESQQKVTTTAAEFADWFIG